MFQLNHPPNSARRTREQGEESGSVKESVNGPNNGEEGNHLVEQLPPSPSTATLRLARCARVSSFSWFYPTEGGHRVAVKGEVYTVVCKIHGTVFFTASLVAVVQSLSIKTEHQQFRCFRLFERHQVKAE